MTENIKAEKQNKFRKLASLYWEFFKIGLFTIGGGMAMIPQIQQVAVNDKKWLSEEEMLDCIAISQSLPGVIAINCGTYIGRRSSGTAGAIAATTGVISPSFIIIILAVTLLSAFDQNPYIAGAFTGVKAAVCGLIIVTALRLAKQNIKTTFQKIVAVCAFLLIGLIGINAVWVIIAGAISGVIYYSVKSEHGSKEKHKEEEK